MALSEEEIKQQIEEATAAAQASLLMIEAVAVVRGDMHVTSNQVKVVKEE